MALVAFAANSVLCRLALGTAAIDAGSFTLIRLLSGCIALTAILRISRYRGGQDSGDRPGSRGSWAAGVALFVYAIAFSFAYTTLDTGTGALILFGAVQITMILLSIREGNRLHPVEWAGICAAFAGFVYLILPGVSTPSLVGFVLMSLAGMAWGVYTLRGRGSTAPLADTGYNFLRTLPIALVVVLPMLPAAHISGRGFLLAVISGGVASGIGYAIWYTALRGLSATRAAVVQLAVPLIAASGGVVFSGEVITWRLVMSAALILGGILLVVLAHSRN